MSFNYNISILELLDILGCKPNLEYHRDSNLPDLLNDFLSRIYKHPLFKTADIWTEHPAWRSYEIIEERIDEDREYYEEHPEEFEGNSYEPFFRLSKDKWSELVANYVEIGSDYAAGVVEFGIRDEDLKQENPMVYMLHEEDAPIGWKRFSETLSDYLKYVVCAVLCCESYSTGKNVLEKEGWKYMECEKPKDAPLTPCIFNLAVCCGYDSDAHTILAILSLSDAQCKTVQITKES